MNAVLLNGHGGLEKLEYGQVPTPKPNAGEVLVRVRACALNHLDIWTRMGMPGVEIKMPHILGCDISGEIAGHGPDVSGFRAGQRVLLLPGMSCGNCDACAAGWDSACDQYKIIGFLRPGGYAEYVSVPSRNVIPVSDKLKFEEWASIPLVFLTAWHMLVKHGRLAKGETVLIQGASSGVGSAAIQIAKYFGATVITTVGDDGKAERAKKLGANFIVNYQTTRTADEVKKISKGRGVDLVIDHIGNNTWEQSLASLAKRGRLVTCGATTGGDVKFNLRYLFTRQISITGSYMGGRPALLEIVKLVEAGNLKPVVDKTFPLKQAAQAQERMESRRHFGKIILITT
ncbi:MAG: zinc-binding dehydrogenase [Candidatus Omnitrophica bacterium]|nr:zinc-binding dehydrogenase [Candidatus Omnitrophota bacterium]